MPRPRIHRYLNRNGRIGWESLLCLIIDDTCPSWIKAQFQLPLRGGPQRADVILIKKRGVEREKVTLLNALYSRLDSQNMLELKGGTQRVGKQDPTRLLGYACQYIVREWERQQARSAKDTKTQRPSTPDLPTLKLIYLAPRMSEATQAGVKAREGTLKRTEPGVWEGRMAGFPLLFLETDLLWQTSRGNILLYLNSFAGADPDEVKKEMTEEERRIYNRAIGMVQDGHETTEEDMAMTVSQKIAKRYAEFEREQVKKASVELRLEGLTAEERLRGLSPEELRKALPPEERLKGLQPDEKKRIMTSPDLLSLLPESMAQALLTLLNSEPAKT